MKVYLVGGAVRDKLMDRTPKDFDFSVVLDSGSYADPFEWMKEELTAQGFKIFVETPEHLTVRAQFPVGSGGFLDGMTNIPGKKRLTADFVLARKEGAYTDGRRPDYVTQGDLMDDLKRRDFTMNAIAQDEAGYFIDPFNGQADIRNKIIRCVGNSVDRMMEDSLRALRALRFHVTLGFDIDPNLNWVLLQRSLAYKLRSVSDERKMDELNKMFRHNSLNSIRVLNKYPALCDAVFSGRVNLMATMKEKGFK